MDREIVRNVEDSVTDVHTVVRGEDLKVCKEEAEDGVGVPWKPGDKIGNHFKSIVLEKKY